MANCRMKSFSRRRCPTTRFNRRIRGYSFNQYQLPVLLLELESILPKSQDSAARESLESISFQVLRAAQDSQGKPVPITPMGPKRPGPRASFTTGGGIWDQLRVVVRDRDAW